MNKRSHGLLLCTVLIASMGCGGQKPPDRTEQMSARDFSHTIYDVRLELITRPPEFAEAEIEIVRHTRETISHYFDNPNDFYISAISVGDDSIRVDVDLLDHLQRNYHLYFASDGYKSGRAVVVADDSFRPVSFLFDKNYKLLKCNGNWYQDCEPVW